MVERVIPIKGRVFIPSYDITGREGAHLDSGRRYKVLGQHEGDRDAFIIENPTGHSQREFNSDSVEQLRKLGLINEDTRLFFIVDGSRGRIVNSNEYGCKFRCEPCKDKCELYREES